VRRLPSRARFMIKANPAYDITQVPSARRHWPSSTCPDTSIASSTAATLSSTMSVTTVVAPIRSVTPIGARPATRSVPSIRSADVPTSKMTLDTRTGMKDEG